MSNAGGLRLVIKLPRRGGEEASSASLPEKRKREVRSTFHGNAKGKDAGRIATGRSLDSKRMVEEASFAFHLLAYEQGAALQEMYEVERGSFFLP